MVKIVWLCLALVQLAMYDAQKTTDQRQAEYCGDQHRRRYEQCKTPRSQAWADIENAAESVQSASANHATFEFTE